MAFKFPYTNFHALNLDWIIQKIKDLASAIPTKVSQLENDAGYITSAQSGAVDSVNGMTGAVVLDASDVGALPDNYTAPVTSVNSKTGAVVLDADDVGALPDSYTAPVTSVNSKTSAVVLDADDVGALANPVLLWTNSDLSAEFTAQQITLDLSNYQFIYILFKQGTGASFDELYPMLCYNTPTSYWQTGNFGGSFTRRRITINSAGIYVELSRLFASYAGGIADNGNYLIPARIYGI